MKYENMEFERNFQLKPCNEPKKSADEPKKLASNSAKADGKSEETHDDAIEVNTIILQRNYLKKLINFVLIDSQRAFDTREQRETHLLVATNFD